MYCSCVYPAGALCPDPYGSVNHCSGSSPTALPYNKNTRHPEQFSGFTVFQPHFIIIRKCEQHQNRRIRNSLSVRRSLFPYHHIFSGSSKSLHIASWPPEVIFIIFFSIFIVSCKSIPKRPMNVLNSSCRLHRNPSGKTASPLCYGRDAACLISFCFHALNRAILISTERVYHEKINYETVSMPSIGQSSFLLK